MSRVWVAQHPHPGVLHFFDRREVSLPRFSKRARFEPCRGPDLPDLRHLRSAVILPSAFHEPGAGLLRAKDATETIDDQYAATSREIIIGEDADPRRPADIELYLDTAESFRQLRR